MLNDLLDANAFLPSALPADLLACHVPFDELMPGSLVESGLEDRARRNLAVGLVGASGAGKSAVTAWVLDRVTTDFAPIRAPVFYETEETIRNPGAFARYVLQRLVDEAHAVDALDEARRNALLTQASERLTTPTQTIGHHSAAGIELPWLLKGEVAREITRTVQGSDLTGSTDSVLRAIDRAIEAIASVGLTPMLVVDDTDRWLQVGDIDRRELVGAFFGTIVRMLAERGCGLVVAVHDSYVSLPEYQVGTRGFLTDLVQVPALPGADEIRQILDHRVALQVDNGSSQDVFDGDAIDRLADYYEHAWSSSVRWVLQAAHEALNAAVIAGSERVSSVQVDAAAAAWAV